VASTIHRNRTAYDSDFHAWTVEQSAALRRLASVPAASDVDIEHVAEEIEDLGKSDVRALLSEVALVIEHLLKLEWSPASDPRALWEQDVGKHRFAARQILDDSPGLRQHLQSSLDRCFAQARRQAVRSLLRDRVEPEILPDACSYELDKHILDPDWFPANRHGLDKPVS